MEDEIIDALYGYRDPRTNSRIVSLVLRNRDAVLLGMNGPECGDLVFFLKEGNNRVHADALSYFCCCKNRKAARRTCSDRQLCRRMDSCKILRNCKEKRRWSLAPSSNYGSFDAERLDIADIWNNYRVRDKSFGNLFGYDVGLDFY